MRSLNKITLIGNVGAAPAMKKVGDKFVAEFSVATSESWTKNGEKQEKTNWHRCVAWGRTAEIIGDYVNKGDKIYVEGKSETREYEKDGERRYITEVNVREILLLGGGKGGSSSEKAPTQPESIPTAVTDADADDDLPF